MSDTTLDNIIDDTDYFKEFEMVDIDNNINDDDEWLSLTKIDMESLPGIKKQVQVVEKNQISAPVHIQQRTPESIKDHLPSQMVSRRLHYTMPSIEELHPNVQKNKKHTDMFECTLGDISRHIDNCIEKQINTYHKTIFNQAFS
jgi:hypothetical protein